MRFLDPLNMTPLIVSVLERRKYNFSNTINIKYKEIILQVNVKKKKKEEI